MFKMCFKCVTNVLNGFKHLKIPLYMVLNIFDGLKVLNGLDCFKLSQMVWNALYGLKRFKWFWMFEMV